MSSDYMERLGTLAERVTGMPIADLGRETVTEARERVERKFGKVMTFTWRGKPIDNQGARATGLVSRRQIEADLDRRLK